MEFVEVPTPEGAFSLDRFRAAIDEHTRLVMMSTVNYSTGLRPPVDQIGPLLGERGVLFYVDATQSLGALRLNAREIQADMVAAHGYKWLLCPAGIGVAYISPRVREWLAPSLLSWRSDRNWCSVDMLHHGPPDLPEEAYKYEGGIQNFPGIYAMGAVLQMMTDLGLDNIETRLRQLSECGRDVLRGAGGKLPVDRLPFYDSPILAAQFPGTDVSRLAARLRENRVVVSARHGYLRVSPHFFNDEEDLAKLGRMLQAG